MDPLDPGDPQMDPLDPEYGPLLEVLIRTHEAPSSGLDARTCSGISGLPVQKDPQIGTLRTSWEPSDPSWDLLRPPQTLCGRLSQGTDRPQQVEIQDR